MFPPRCGTALAISSGVLISRCAWHRRYHGYTKVLGISEWRGMHVNFTDGICQKCAARVRADHLRARFDRGASADRREPAWMPGLAVVGLAIVVGLVLVARPTHEPPGPPPIVALLPESTVEPEAMPEPQPPTPRPRAVRPPRGVVRPARAAIAA